MTLEEIIQRRIATVSAAIVNIRGAMSTGRGANHNGAILSRAMFHLEVLQDVWNEYATSGNSTAGTGGAINKTGRGVADRSGRGPAV